MSSKVAVVIPTYKEELNELEKISLAQVKKVLGKYPLIFVAPEGKNLSYLEQSNGTTYFPPQFFKSKETYNYLMTSPAFYKTFDNYDYILIYQLDAFVFYDALEYFCSLGYDYIGAPWPRSLAYKFPNYKAARVGNGGFSLRNVKACYNVLINHAELINQWNKQKLPEDVFFGYCGVRDDCDFNVAPLKVAYKFSAEYNPVRVIKKNCGTLPFGCHDWSHYNPEFYAKIFLNFGYDLNHVLSRMFNHDNYLKSWLIKFSMQRLIRRVNRGQALMRYLPKKYFASVRVVNSPLTKTIFERLIIENPRLANECYLYEESEQDILISDLILRRGPHLIIAFGVNVDEALISVAEKKGISYGKRIISFLHEYVNSCEKLFHNLGK